MEKPAQIEHPIHEFIQRRWSPRAFSSRPIEPEKIGSLLEALRWAASSRNEQPWRILLIDKLTHAAAHARMVGCLSTGNQPWAANAPCLALLCAALQFSDGAANRHAVYDCGQAAATMTFQATALDLWVHQMAGFDPAKARTAFGVPEGLDLVCVLAIGYYGDPATLPENRRVQELAARVRKPLSEVAFDGIWGEPWSKL